MDKEELKSAIREVNNETSNDMWTSIEGCAQRLGISPRTVQNRIYLWNKGQTTEAMPFFTHIRVYRPHGANYRFRIKDINNYVDKMECK